MKRVIALVAGILACQGSGDVAKSAPKPAPAQPTQPAKPDPWATTAANDAPSLNERHERADKYCPSVTGPYFYALEKKGKTSYILGTRHIGVALAKFPQVVRDKIDAAKLVVFEVAPDDEHPTTSKQISLPAVLGDRDWAHYQELVGPAEEESSAAAALLMMTALYEDFTVQLEKDIEQEAGSAHIKMRGLETAKFQDELIDKLLDLRMLRAAVEQTKNRAELAKDSADDLAEYCAGTDDSPGIDGHQRDEMLAAGYTQKEIDAIDEQIVYARNASWIPKLDKLFATSGVFVAVGADHLIGPRGVISLMTARGYKATRIKS